MTGRGRGRGRGILTSDLANCLGGLQEKTEDNETVDSDNNSKPERAKRSPIKTTGSATLSEDDIQTILQDSRTYSDQYDVKKVMVLVQNFVRCEKDVKTVACAIYQKCMEDSSLAKQGAEICNRLTGIEVGNVKFRNCLLTLVQGDYKIRKEILSSSPVHYNGFLAFLCEIFNVMRTVTGEVFKPLIVPVYDVLGLVVGIGQSDETEDGETDTEVTDLDELDDDACDILSYQLQYVGRLLEEHDEAKMKALVNRIRTCIIHSKSSPRARCSLLEVLEAHARSWESAPNDTTKYYCDMSVGIISGLVL